METPNQHVIFIKRPGNEGAPDESCFKSEECPKPDPNLADGEVIIRTSYLSVDPALRCRMNEETGVEYLTPWEIGKTVEGLGGVGVVIASKSGKFKVGDNVACAMKWPWARYWKTADADLINVNIIPPGFTHRIVLSCLGLIGLTVLLGIQEKGHLVPAKKQTFVVSGAAGACGTLAGQIAKIMGCARVIGICGSKAKCDMITSELKFDGAINYKEEDVAASLKQQCPDGVDIYFDNVGGDVSEKVILQMNKDSHVILCGQISQYNKDVPYPPPISPEVDTAIKSNNITRERYLVLNYKEKFGAAQNQLAIWLMQGKLKVKESVVEGVENTGNAFVDMMNGKNIGKQIVHVSDS